MISEYLNDWQTETGATESELANFSEHFHRELPEAYRTFLRMSNGGQGVLGELYIQAWSLDEVVKNNEQYGIRKRLCDHVFGIATEGDYCFALDYRGSHTPSLICFPLGGIAWEEVVIVGPTYEDGFLRVATGKFGWRDFVPR